MDGVNLAPQIGNLGGASAYLSVASGSRHIQIENASTSTVYIDNTSSLAGGTATTFLAANFPPTLASLVLTDDNSAPASGSFKLRVINASPSSGPVDVYVVPTGTGIGTTPTFSGLSSPSASVTYASNIAGSFQVIFAHATTQNLILTSVSTSYIAGQVRTIVLVDDSSNLPTTTLLNDLN